MNLINDSLSFYKTTATNICLVSKCQKKCDFFLTITTSENNCNCTKIDNNSSGYYCKDCLLFKIHEYSSKIKEGNFKIVNKESSYFQFWETNNVYTTCLSHNCKNNIQYDILEYPLLGKESGSNSTPKTVKQGCNECLVSLIVNNFTDLKEGTLDLF